jgi:very-short-patch-repair endonuclease
VIAEYVLFALMLLISIPGVIGYIQTWRNRGKGGDGTWCESPIERRLYNVLASRGYEVKAQVPCGRYRIDLALPRYRIAIECDGKAYHSSRSQKAHDRKKDQFLRDHGWTVLRFTGSQINGKMAYVIRKIEESVARLR